MRRRALLAGVALAALVRATPGAGQTPAAGTGPAVTGVWSRPALRARTGVLYFRVTGGAEDDVLVRVDAEVSARAELHRSSDDGGVMRMRPVTSIDAPAGAVVELAPAGFHVMLSDLKRNLHAGDTFGVTLTFQRAGRVEATASVRGPSAPAAAMDGMPLPEQPARR